MAKFLIHIHTGPENPSTAALGFLVAMTALKESHQVNLFLAGDGASLIGDAALSSIEGKGTGNLGAHYKALGRGRRPFLRLGHVGQGARPKRGGPQGKARRVCHAGCAGPLGRRRRCGAYLLISARAKFCETSTGD